MFVNNLYFLALTGIIMLVGSRMHYLLRVRELGLTIQLDQSRQRLEQTNQRLIELDQVKTRFFANISHELRTPLTLLLAPLETLSRRSAIHWPPEDQELLSIMHTHGMRLLKLISDLLDLVRLESGRVSVRQERVDADAFARGLAGHVAHAAQVKQLQLKVEIEEQLGTVCLDRDKLEKVLLNLLFNALKFTEPGGSVTLHAKRTSGQLEFSVADTGIGISPEQLPHVFERFWQADSSSSRRHQGLGIGLALVKELIEAQGGRVDVQSSEGHGSTFTVSIPCTTPDPTLSLDSAPSPHPQNAPELDTGSPEWLAGLYRRAELFPAMLSATDRNPTTAIPPAGDRPVVVLADDEPHMVRFIRSQLTPDFHVVEANTGREAVDRARTSNPNLVVLDMMMPELDGLEACREIRQIEELKSIPVIMLTARADEETKLATLAAGANDFLTKPFSTTELLLRIRNLIQTHRLQRELARQNHRLAETIEHLKETEVQLVQMEKLASLGRLSAGIIHEINNPLNFVTTNLYTLRRRLEHLDPDTRRRSEELLADVDEGVRRVREIVTNLRSFTHPGGGPVEDISVAEIAEAAVRFLSHEIREKIHLAIDLADHLYVRGERNRLLQVLVNLLQNSVDALVNHPRPDLSPLVQLEARQHDSEVWISVRDNGPGISPEILDKIFDPFFTTKEVGEGLGLGLSISYRIVRQAGGHITAKSEPGRFTEILVRLPAGRTAPPAA